MYNFIYFLTFDDFKVKMGPKLRFGEKRGHFNLEIVISQEILVREESFTKIKIERREGIYFS